MQFPLIQRILGILLAFYSLTLLPPLLLSWYHWDIALPGFAATFFGIGLLGLLLFRFSRKPERGLDLRGGFIVIVAFWVVLSLVSAAPFMFDPLKLSLAGAVFEAISGFTTTGATVITGLDSLPLSVHVYRQQLQFIGGLGVIVIAIAVLPMLGIGGLQLYRAETPGPMRDEQLTPRVAQTAKFILYSYIGLNAACTLAYYFAGMSFFDALMHSFSTLSTGGFSTHDDSIAYFKSPLIEWIAIFFMILGGLNFTVHFLAFSRLSIRPYRNDIQTVGFIWIALAISLLCTVALIAYPAKALQYQYDGFLEAFRYATFQVVSIMSTTGFLTTDYSQWPAYAPALALASSFIGGCVGSTAGGFRIIRVVLLFKQGMREIQRLIHPSIVAPLRIGNSSVPESVAAAVLGYVALYISAYLVLSLLMLAASPHLDTVSAFSGVAACLNMSGPGLGTLVFTFNVNDAGLWVGSLSMLVGRLEIYPLLILFMPAFWNR
jgi:trk system potassium uptake protein TrkH